MKYREPKAEYLASIRECNRLWRERQDQMKRTEMRFGRTNGVLALSLLCGLVLVATYDQLPVDVKPIGKVFGLVVLILNIAALIAVATFDEFLGPVIRRALGSTVRAFSLPGIMRYVAALRFVFPKKYREQVFDLAVDELRADVSEARRKHKGQTARFGLWLIFLFRGLFLLFDSVRVCFASQITLFVVICKNFWKGA